MLNGANVHDALHFSVIIIEVISKSILPIIFLSYICPTSIEWSMVLMFMILYIWSVIIIEVISNTDQADYMDNKESATHYDWLSD